MVGDGETFLASLRSSRPFRWPPPGFSSLPQRAERGGSLRDQGVLMSEWCGP